MTRRHPKQYPKGEHHPKSAVTQAWKRRVVEALEANGRAGKAPSTNTELAAMIGCDLGGLGRMLTTDQPTYKYARQVNEALGLPDAVVENPGIDGDEWDRIVAIMRGLPEGQQRLALRMLKAFAPDLDDE